MAVKFHINPETGKAGTCTASVKPCKYGESTPHFASATDAQKAFESSMVNQSITSHSKPSTPVKRDFDIDALLENAVVESHQKGVSEIYSISGQMAADAENPRKLDGADADTLRSAARRIDEVIESSDFSDFNSSRKSIDRIENMQAEMNREANETEDDAKATALFRASESVADVLIKLDY